MEKNNLSASSTPTSSSTSNRGNTFSTGSGSSIAAAAVADGSSVYSQGTLKALNKASFKISKPVVLSRSSNPSPNMQKAPPLPVVAPVSAGVPVAPPQPPVYNIDKNNFRDVVQKLTGSPAHHHAPCPVAPSAAPPAVTTPVAPSRLHRIRPPPLGHLASRPLPLAPAVQQPVVAMDQWTWPTLSPLPPLPTVSAAAESPISAYMRRLHSSGVGGGQVGFTTAAADSGAQPSGIGPPSSPLGFGCLPSPWTAYRMMMAPGLSPTSPGVQLSSPRLREP